MGRPRPNLALGLPRSVWLLGWVSLATDAATEAIYPVMPLFLTQVLGTDRQSHSSWLALIATLLLFVTIPLRRT